MARGWGLNPHIKGELTYKVGYAKVETEEEMRVQKTQTEGGMTYTARVGDFFGPVRHSAHEALEALDFELERFHPLDHTYIRCGDGTVLHIFQIPSHRWNYRIIPPTGYKGEGRGPQETYAKTVELARRDAQERFGGVVET